jgi:ABC-type antimicrobial peptide transport system permease subunit
LWWLLFFGTLLVIGVTRMIRPLRALAGAGLLLAALYLGYVDLAVRGSSDPAFWGLWAAALWLSIATLAGLAAWLSPRASAFADEPLVPALWIGAGVLLLFGVTGELGRFFVLRDLEGSTAALWTGLSISVWWILFACGLVLLGFRRDLRHVRQAGLLVAAMAAVKIVVHDLSSLDALYRVGSVFITGLVSLLLAYLYNRKARDA